MPRKTTPSFVVELPLDTTLSDETQLNKKVFEAAKRLNNVLLKEGLSIVQAIRNDPAWEAARKRPKADKEQRIVRAQAFQAVRKAHHFTDFDFQHLAIKHKNAAGFAGRLGSHTTQKLGTKVFKALERYLLGLSGQPRFKGVKRPLHSIEGKNNAADLRWNEDDGCVYLTASWAIKAVLPDLRKDEWLWSALQNPVKYCRIVRRFVGEKNHFSLQLVMEGLTPMKASMLSRLSAKDSKAGIDIGPSNIAWVTETDAGLFKFCADVETPQKLLRVLQRKVDRQNRANNPDNFKENGQAKRGCTWVKSKTQKLTEKTLRSLHSTLAEKRANAHGRDINTLLGKARTFNHDGVSVKSLQKNYGKSVLARSPGRFMSELKRKAERADGYSHTINSRQLKTSQYDHSIQENRKKTLSERWHVFGDGRGRVQRDIYSAFLALHVQQTIDADGVCTEFHNPSRLEEKWLILEPALVSKGLFIKNESVNTSTTRKVDRASIPLLHDTYQLPNCNESRFCDAPASRGRGAVRVKKNPSV